VSHFVPVLVIESSVGSHQLSWSNSASLSPHSVVLVSLAPFKAAWALSLVVLENSIELSPVVVSVGGFSVSVVHEPISRIAISTGILVDSVSVSHVILERSQVTIAIRPLEESVGILSKVVLEVSRVFRS